MHRLPLLSLALTFPLLVTGQAAKVEREFGLQPEEAPPAARQYIDSVFATARRLKYYKDVGEDRTTIEAKFKLARTRYSVEFEESGQWYNTEVDVAVDSVPAVVWREACGVWADTFELYRVSRVQHHVGRDDGRYYEVELRARRKFIWGAYQARISETGALLGTQEIELGPGHLERW